MLQERHGGTLCCERRFPRCVFCQAHKIAIVATIVTVIMHIPIVTVILPIGENATGFQSSLPRAVEDYRFGFRFWGDFQTHLASSLLQYACESVHFCTLLRKNLQPV